MKIKYATKFIKNTETYILRGLSADDINTAYMEYFHDSKRYEYTSIGNGNINIENQKAYVSGLSASEKDGIFGVFEISDNLIGTIGVQNIENDLYEPTIGILIANPKYLGIGLSSSLIYAVSNLIFHYTATNKIYAGIENTNIPSIRAFIKVGFKESYQYNYDPRFLPLKKNSQVYSCTKKHLVQPTGIREIELFSE